jgi:hypothetical protein
MNTSSQETQYHDHNIHIDYSMFEGSFLFPCFMRNSVYIYIWKQGNPKMEIEESQTTQTLQEKWEDTNNGVENTTQEKQLNTCITTFSFKAFSSYSFPGVSLVCASR